MKTISEQTLREPAYSTPDSRWPKGYILLSIKIRQPVEQARKRLVEKKG